MIIHGKDRKFLLTVGASAEISEYCPGGDLGRMSELFEAQYSKQVRNVAKIIAAMSRGYENQRHYEDPSYEPVPLTVDEILSTDQYTFQLLSQEALDVFRGDQSTTVEVEESKKKGTET